MADGRASDTTVVHVIPRYPPSLGGAEKVAQSLVNMRRHHNTTLVLTSRDSHDAVDPSEGGFVRRFRALDVANTRIVPGLAGALLRLPRAAVVHLHVNSAFLPEAVYAARVLRGTRYVAHLHFDINTCSSWAGFVFRRAWLPVVFSRVLRAAAGVIVLTESQRREIISRYGVDPARIIVIRNGVEDSFFNDNPRALHVKPRLLFVGRLAAEKNVSLLLSALAGVSERFETTLVGEGYLEQELKRQATDLGLKNVHFYGRADGEELRNLYRAADVFVLPSKSEGMSLVLLEALAMGLPVVATDLSSNRDVIVNGANGVLVTPDNPVALQAALVDIVEDGDWYQRMSETARKVAEQYRWDAVADDFERAYGLARRRARR